MADYEFALARIGPEDPLRSQIEAWHGQEKERLQKSQDLLAKLVKIRTAALEVIEKTEG